MQRPISIGAAAVVALMLLWNVFALKGIDARLDALEAAGPLRATEVANIPRNTPRTPRTPKKGKERPSKLAQLDRDDPEVRERLVTAVGDRKAERVADRSELAREELTVQVEAFAAEVGLDAETVGRILGEFERRSDDFLVVREDVRLGNTPWTDARSEFEQIKSDSDATLRELLGDAWFEQLDAQLEAERSGRAR